MTKSASVEDYLAAQPDDTRNVLVNLRAVVLAALPGAEETISYGIPTFTVDGRAVVHVAGWRSHVSLYPAPGPTNNDPGLADDLAAYVTGKGTVRFDLDQPVPYELAERVVVALAARERG